MKKIIYSIFLIILVAGVSGCMKQPTADENKANEKAMLSYLNKKYGREFTSVEYLPAKRGFNNFMNENVLVTKSEDGILVNVREKVGEKGDFYDDYLNSYASKLFEGKIDYSGIKNIQGAKTYVTLMANDNNLKELLNGEFTLSNEKINRRYCIISISSKADEEVLKQLYDVYRQMYSLGEERNTLIVAFSGDKSKATNYVNNFLLYGTQDWEKYDKSVKEILAISQKELSFEQFKGQLIKVGD